MSFSEFFSEQARKPAGMFGRIVMSAVFDKGNADLNRLVRNLMSVQADDHVLEIGMGTGKLICEMAGNIRGGRIEGVDFSDTMAAIARRRNRKYIKEGRVRIIEGNFDDTDYQESSFNKICSVNTIYFWPRPEYTSRKILGVLQPGGKLVVAFEDESQLAKRNLDRNVFRLYSKGDVEGLLISAGFPSDVRILSIEKGRSIFHCVCAEKRRDNI